MISHQFDPVAFSIVYFSKMQQKYTREHMIRAIKEEKKREPRKENMNNQATNPISHTHVDIYLFYC